MAQRFPVRTRQCVGNLPEHGRSLGHTHLLRLPTNKPKLTVIRSRAALLSPKSEAPERESENGVAVGDERAGSPPRRRVIFGICAVALFMVSIDATIVATALPRIGTALHAHINWVGWTITIYQLGQMIALPLAGKLGDRFGRKRFFLVCAAIFVIASFACGMSSDIYLLIAFRFIQGLGGGAFMPSASGIAAEYFGHDRDRALGMFTSIMPIGGIIGPVFGGVIAQYWSWRGIFFINIPVGIVLLGLISHYIPRSEPREFGRLDGIGIGLLSATILAGMLAVASLGERTISPTDPRILAAGAVAILLGWAFLHRSRRVEEPVIAMQFLRGRNFGVVNFVNMLFGGAVFGFASLLPIYASSRYGIPLSHAATILSARGLGMIAVAAAATMMLRRTGYRLPMTVGFLTIALGFVMLSISPHGLSPYWWLALFAVLTGIGMGISAPAANNATLQLAPDHVAAIAGLRVMFRTMGGILYVSIATAILARSANPGIAEAHILLVQAVILLFMTALIYTIPDHKGTW